nr:Smr/MutS family protein [Conchiformibius kuhniae]
MTLQDQLQALHRQAQHDAEQRRAAEREAQRLAREAGETDFAALMADVVPLKPRNTYYPPPDRSPIKPRRHNHTADDDGENLFFIGEGGAHIDIPATFSKNGQGANDIKRLQAGHLPVVADVDLHGYTQEEAQKVLNEFIVFVQKRGVCGEIVHGSGLGSRGYTPVLKSLVRRWLMQHPDVLAYAEPRPNNDGAVRILLKRPFRRDPYAEDKD